MSLMESVEQIYVFGSGILGAFIWILFSYYLVPDFHMEISIIGERKLIIIWCSIGGILAWLLDVANSYGLHPALLCGIFTGFGWSGLFTGVAGMRLHRRDKTEADNMIGDLNE